MQFHNSSINMKNINILIFQFFHRGTTYQVRINFVKKELKTQKLAIKGTILNIKIVQSLPPPKKKRYKNIFEKIVPVQS